jgi:hypothetical protein
MVTISMSPARGIFQSDASAYALDVKKGDALTVVAMEWTGPTQTARSFDETKHRFVKLEVPAQSADATLDLDLASGTPLTPVEITVTLKAPDASSLGGAPGWQVQSEKTGGLFFLGSRSKVSATAETGNTFIAEGEYVASPIPDDAPHTFVYFPGGAGEFALVQKIGFPADGATYEALAFPKSPGKVALGAVIPLTNLDSAADGAGIEVLDDSLDGNGGAVWFVHTLPGAPPPASLVLPDLPDAARAILPSRIHARLLAVAGELDETRKGVPSRIAFSKYFTVTK